MLRSLRPNGQTPGFLRASVFTTCAAYDCYVDRRILIPRDNFREVFSDNYFSQLSLEACTHVSTQTLADEQLARIVTLWANSSDEKRTALAATTTFLRIGIVGSLKRK